LRDPVTGQMLQMEDLPIARALAEHVGQSAEYTVHVPGDTTPAWIKASASPLFDGAGNVAGAVAVLVDVTNDRNEEQEKSDFLSAAAHDLKSPLTTIKGFTQILLRRLARGTMDPERTREDLEQIVRTVTQMSRLISELLDATRVESGRALELQRSPIDLEALLNALADVHRQTSPDHSITVDVTAGDLVGVWDGERLERALDNILTNAIKYSLDGSTVAVTVDREEGAQGPAAVVRVTDQGIGIPAEDLPHIFDRYYRARNASSQAMGSGFGLTAARHIIEQHGGTIVAASVQGAGSTFTIRLPLGGPAEG
jgi:two-component system sensor histidine kinase ResE